MRSAKVSLVAIFLLALALRIPGLGDSFYGDEGFSLLRDSSQLITNSEDRFRPVYFSLLYLWRQFGFSGEIGLRILPLIFGLLQIPLAFIVGRKLLNDKLALLFAGLVAASPLLIEFSQELRMYSLVGLIALLQMWNYLALREQFTWLKALAFVAIALLGVYTHLHYWLFLAGFALAFWQDRRAIPLLKSFVLLSVTLALYLPNISHVLRFTHERGGEYAMDLASALPKLLAAFAVGYNYFALPELGITREIDFSVLAMNLPLILLAAVPVLILFWQLVRMQMSIDDRAHLRLVHAWFTIPILLALIAALVTGKNWLQPKYLIFSAPAFLLGFAFAFLWMNRQWKRWIVGVASVLVLGIAVAHFYDQVHYGRREDWRGAAQILSRELNDQSSLVLTQGTWWLLDYYAPGVRTHAPELHLPERGEKAAFELNHELAQRLAGDSVAFYLRFDTVQKNIDPGDRVPRALDGLGARIGDTQLNPRLRLMKWKLN